MEGPINCTPSELSIYLQALAGGYLATSCSDINVSVPLKSMDTVKKFYKPDKRTEYSRGSRSFQTLRRLTDARGVEVLTWFQGDSPARTYHAPEKGKESAAKDRDYGPSSPGSLAKYNPDLYSWKTRQCLLLGGLETFSGTFPTWGMMRDGELWALDTPAHLTTAIESGLWPTPTATDWHGAAHKQKKKNVRLNHFCFSLGRRDLEHNAKFREWLMGWPIGWTELNPSEKVKFRRWLNSHGKF